MNIVCCVSGLVRCVQTAVTSCSFVVFVVVLSIFLRVKFSTTLGDHCGLHCAITLTIDNILRLVESQLCRNSIILAVTEYASTEIVH